MKLVRGIFRGGLLRKEKSGMNEQGSCRLRLAQDNINRINQIGSGTGGAHEPTHLSAEFTENIDD